MLNIKRIINRKNNSSGFTITELLVVIIVIGVLATITIISYVGISRNAETAALAAVLKENSTQLELYKATYGAYPSELDSNYCPIQANADNTRCLKTSPGVDLTYISRSPNTTYSLLASKGSNSSSVSSNNSTVGPYLGLSCRTQEYSDGLSNPNIVMADDLKIKNCIDITKLVTPADIIAGSEKLDTNTGLIWSNALVKNLSNINFSAVINTKTNFSWNAVIADNLSKTASVLCTEKGNNWRLPTQKELIQVYINGSFATLINANGDFWSATEFNSTDAWAVTLWNGNVFSYGKGNGSSVRCVRSSDTPGSLMGSCSTQKYHDSYGPPATTSTNCVVPWVAVTDGIAGSDKKDPISGLTWSNILLKTGATVGFTISSGTVWTWDSSGTNNAGTNSVNKTAIGLCSGLGNGWRLPTQKELLQAYVNGANFYLYQPSNKFWSATSYDISRAHYANLASGDSNVSTKITSASMYIRCVR